LIFGLVAFGFSDGMVTEDFGFGRFLEKLGVLCEVKVGWHPRGRLSNF